MQNKFGGKSIQGLYSYVVSGPSLSKW